MSYVEHVPVETKLLKHLIDLLGKQEGAKFQSVLKDFRDALGGRVFWHVNSTAKGGGVAEMLPHLMGYMLDYGIDTRWLVISGRPDFFQFTKRMHHALHGSLGDGSPLGEKQHKLYLETLANNAKELLEIIDPEDIVLLHDPQTAGLLPELTQRGNPVAWRCHIGHDEKNLSVEQGWAFLSRYISQAQGYVFSRDSYVPTVVDKERCCIIAPSIDPLSPKNTPLPSEIVDSILTQIGLYKGEVKNQSYSFILPDGSKGLVTRKADIVRSGNALNGQYPMIVQVSRWDPLKDPIGVMNGFAQYIEKGGPKAILLLVGPDVSSVADDPEGLEVYQDTIKARSNLEPSIQELVQLVSLPMDNVVENAYMVNAIQRKSAIVIQKSLHEGFGLTVTEAMWKGKPVIASAVGGIQDQITDQKNGILVRNPTDPEEFAQALHTVLSNSKLQQTLGQKAKQQVIDNFLVSRHIRQFYELVQAIQPDGVWSQEAEDRNAG